MPTHAKSWGGAWPKSVPRSSKPLANHKTSKGQSLKTKSIWFSRGRNKDSPAKSGENIATTRILMLQVNQHAVGSANQPVAGFWSCSGTAERWHEGSRGSLAHGSTYPNRCVAARRLNDSPCRGSIHSPQAFWKCPGICGKQFFQASLTRRNHNPHAGRGLKTHGYLQASLRDATQPPSQRHWSRSGSHSWANTLGAITFLKEPSETPTPSAVALNLRVFLL